MLSVSYALFSLVCICWPIYKSLFTLKSYLHRSLIWLPFISRHRNLDGIVIPKMWVCLCAKQCVSCTKLFCAIQSFEGYFGFAWPMKTRHCSEFRSHQRFQHQQLQVQKLDDVLSFDRCVLYIKAILEWYRLPWLIQGYCNLFCIPNCSVTHTFNVDVSLQ